MFVVNYKSIKKSISNVLMLSTYIGINPQVFYIESATLRKPAAMSIFIVILGVLALLLLIVVFKLNAFIALVLVALGVGVAEGMAVTEALASVQKGIGDTLGSLALILGFGAMLGNLVSESGAAQRIT